MDDINKKIQLLRLDEIDSTLFIGAILISIFIAQNQINKYEGKPYYDTYKIELGNRLLVLGIIISFLYISVENYEISKKENKDLKPFILQIVASVITLVAGLITLYIVFYNKSIDEADVENPEV